MRKFQQFMLICNQSVETPTQAFALFESGLCVGPAAAGADFAQEFPTSE
jgi:hypothetical protein